MPFGPFKPALPELGVSDPACHLFKGNFGTFVLIFSKDTQLRVGRSPLLDDSAAAPRLLGAGERLGIGRREVEDPVEQFADGDAARSRHEAALRAVALG